MRARATATIRTIARPISYVVFGLAFAMLLCAGAGAFMDLVFPPDKAQLRELAGVGSLLWSGLLTASVGAMLWISGQKVTDSSFRRREATLTVAVIWGGASLLGALPFIIDADYSLPNALFESTSGFTTTGATITTDIEGSLSRPILLWRSLIQWLGGMGIVVLFVAIFPTLGVGGKHMFRSEVPGATAEGVRPRIAETSIALWKLYFGFTVAEIAILWLLGMSLFESICHAFTTMSTGGFSTRDASVGAFGSPAIEMAIAGFMFIAGANFGLYYAMLKGRSIKVVLKSLEFRMYMYISVAATVLLTIGIRGNHNGSWIQAARYAVFSVATTMTSTGYGTDDYMAYPPGAILIIIIMMFIGGCSGSTAGGIKVERVILLCKQAWSQIHRSFRPAVVQIVRMGRRPVDGSLLSEVGAFFILFMLVLLVGTFSVTVLEGGRIPAQTAFGALLSCLSNMGPAPYYVGADNFAAYHWPAKLIFSSAMLLGRLELFTLLALLLPEFWRH